MEAFKYNKDDPKAIDEAYQQWVKANQKGFVANVTVRANGTAKKIKLHHAWCETLNPGNYNLIDGSKVRKGIDKICSTSLDELKTWAQGQPCGWDWCGRC